MLPLALQHGGAGLRLGYDSGFPSRPATRPPAPFTGVVHASASTRRAPPPPDPADEVRAALHGD